MKDNRFDAYMDTLMESVSFLGDVESPSVALGAADYLRIVAKVTEFYRWRTDERRD